MTRLSIKRYLCLGPSLGLALRAHARCDQFGYPAEL
jgi:hypothetical protein